MNVLDFVKNSGGRIFGDDFDITKVNTLNNALNNIPNKDNASNYDLMVLFNWVYSMAALIAVGFIVYGAIFMRFRKATRLELTRRSRRLLTL